MKIQQDLNYDRIAQAIDFIKEHFKDQPSLEAIAHAVHLSPYHFQRMFKEWAGVTPKKFLQYISIEFAKSLLEKEKASLNEAAFETGLSSSSRLHDLFISIEGMTPGAYKKGGAKLTIHYSYAESPFGLLLIASTAIGICHIAFVKSKEAAFLDLKAKFPYATFTQMVDLQQQNALYIFTKDWSKIGQIKLHLKGTPFQIKVWEALLKVPFGGLTTYGKIAANIQQPKASRAVGTAIGKNPVAFLIPCHRVIRGDGQTGNYMWGSTRKTAIIGWEAARLS